MRPVHCFAIRRILDNPRRLLNITMEWLRERYLQIMSLTRNQLLNGQTLRRRISSQKGDIFIQNWNGQSWHGQSLATIIVDAQDTQLGRRCLMIAAQKLRMTSQH